MEALIVVDVQNDFCPGGALAVTDGDQVVERVNELADAMGFVVATRDWHPRDHSSFVEQGGPWPVHCVQGTPGAELHPGVRREWIDLVLDKGQVPELDGYSGFQGTALDRLLRERDVEKVHVASLALDYCVKETALDARRAGYEVVVHRDATRPVEVQAGDGERAVEEIRSAGVEVVD